MREAKLPCVVNKFRLPVGKPVLVLQIGHSREECYDSTREFVDFKQNTNIVAFAPNIKIRLS